MAARITKNHDENTRSRIQTSQLVNRLQTFALGGVDPKTKEPVVIDATRLKAIEILLRKSLPDLAQVQITGEDGGPLQIVISHADSRL